jgi:hypothetical protein
MSPSSDAHPPTPSPIRQRTPRKMRIRRALELSGGLLTALAAISSILALLFAAGVWTPLSHPSYIPTARDFTGVWVGFASPTRNHPSAVPIQLLIQGDVSKFGQVLQIHIYLAENEDTPSTSQEDAQGIVTDGHVILFPTAKPGVEHMALGKWTLTLPDPKILHFVRDTTFDPNDPNDTNSDGDLHQL